MFRGLEIMQKFSQWSESEEARNLPEEEVGKAFVSLLDEALLSNYEEGMAAAAQGGSTGPAPQTGALGMAAAAPPSAGPAMA
ncbi:hypothetical protein UFOVP868_49 [uncultured Caudovirales phage]|uniref:Uncharacterized protein n=1 Tax=uncultured Caudovirales phage TaxID=2100421 RepID=A0A6J5PEB5_9CAUD|nr:hypothetical protein UFOVP868_49 [uncultured Caudovirales phage]